MTTLLSRSAIRELVSWPLMIMAVRKTLLARAAGALPASVSAQVTMPTGLLHLKAGALLSPPILSVKANLRISGQSASGVVVLYDTESGTVTAILDSADITAMRTAALATLAAETLAPVGQIALAVIGAGPVASAVIDAMTERLNVGSLHLWSRDPLRAEILSASKKIPINLCLSPADAARQASVVVTATPARTPLLGAGDVSDGALILALGADSPGKRELDESILARAELFADQASDALRVGECAFLPPGSQNIVELCEILSDQSVHRQTDKQFVVFDSVGSAQIDAAVCESIIQLAKQKHLGVELDFLA